MNLSDRFKNTNILKSMKPLFFKKKDTAIVLFANKRYLFALGAFIINLQKKFSNYDNIIIYTSDLTDDDKNKLFSIDKKIIFYDYSLDLFCKEFDFEVDRIVKISFIRNYTHLTCIKFKIFKHLSKYKTVILFDLDMLLLDSLDEIFNRDYNIIWRSDRTTIAQKLSAFEFTANPDFSEYEVYKQSITPNGGLIIVNDNFDYDKAYMAAHEYFKKFFLCHPCLIDEITFGYVTYTQNLKLYSLDREIYNCIPRDITINTKLVHLNRHYKPWNNEYIQYAFRDWVYNYQQFSRLTGIKSKDVIIFSEIGIKYIYPSDARKRLYDLFECGFVYPEPLKLIPRNGSFACLKYNDNIEYIITPNLNTVNTSFFNLSLLALPNETNSELIVKKILEHVKNETAGLNLKIEQINNHIKLEDSRNIEVKDVQSEFIHFYNITKNLRDLPWDKLSLT